jgi:hypothetical protein
MLRNLAIALVLAAAACHHGSSSTPDGTPGDGAQAGDPLDPSLEPPLDTDPSHYPANVWITDGMVKVHPGATPGALHWADLHAAKNETESFQVHVRAQSAPIALTVTIGELVDARSGAHIDAAHLLVSREAYLDITTRSDANGTLGTTPDPLIPSVDPYVHQVRNAFPVTVPVGETRSAWIDVSVAADAPSGWYSGAVTVTDGGTLIATLPVRLAVWDVTLPSTASLASGFGLSWNGLCVQEYGGYAQCGSYPGSGGDPDTAIELTHLAEANLFLDYRVSLAADVYAMPSNNDWTHFDSLYGPLMDGTAPTRLVGAKLSHLWFTGDQTNATDLVDWHDHFAQKGWLDRTSVYYCDEPPNGCSFAKTQSAADFIHASAPGLATLLTTDITEATDNDLLDRVDVMVPIVESMESRSMPSIRAMYDAWLAKPGKHLWWYQSCDEHESCANGSPGPATATWPSYMVDASPVRNRVFQWLAYMYRIEGELYYDADYCWTAPCGGGSDPWVSIYAFGGNGDGTLFYPGTTAKIGGTQPVPVPSIRLALIRDGMEDYELLHALDAAGDAATAQAAASSFITNNYTFDNDPAKLQAARLVLGNALHERAHP